MLLHLTFMVSIVNKLNQTKETKNWEQTYRRHDAGIMNIKRFT